MANYSNLKTAIENAVDWNNGDNEITGQNLLDILETIIDSLGAKYKFADVATPSSSITTPDEPLFYLAGAGTYTNFGGLSVTIPRGTLAIFYYDTAWHYTTVRTDSDAFFNVNQYLGTPSTTYTKANARNAVPAALRSKGMIITYLTTNGWLIEQNLSTSGTWNADANWQTIGPVSVSQNTSTGHTDINIGGVVNPVASVEEIASVLDEIGYIKTIGVANAWMGLDGTISTHNNYSGKYTDRISCKEGDIFSYQGRSEYNVAGWILRNGNTIVSVGQYRGKTTITIPSGIDNIQFSSYRDGTNPDNVTLIVSRANPKTILDKLSDLETEQEEQSADINGLASDISGIKLLYPQFSLNGYYPVHLIAGGYLNKEGNISSSASSSGKYSDVIPCKQGDVFVYNGNSEYNVAGWILRNGNTIVSVGQYRGKTTITVPSGVDSIQFGSYRSTNDPTTVSLFYNKTSEETMFQFLNPLYCKNVAWDGDSIANGAGFPGGYCNIIAGRNSMVSNNYAISGATVAKETYSGGSPRHWISSSVKSISNTGVDYIVLDGGINDLWNQVPLGSLSSGWSPTFDETTFYGAVESTIRTIYERFTNCKYGWIIVHQGADGGWDFGQPYPTALIACCEKWGFPYLDLRKRVPPMARLRGEDNPLKFIPDNYTNNGDGCHPNELGYKTYYCDYIEEWMKTL